MRLKSLLLASTLALGNPTHGNIQISIGNGEAVSNERVCEAYFDIGEKVNYVIQVCQGLETLPKEGDFGNTELCGVTSLGNRFCSIPEQNYTLSIPTLIAAIMDKLKL